MQQEAGQNQDQDLIRVSVSASGLEYLQSLNLERVVMSQLNPLKVCLPSVTSMFAAVTRYQNLNPFIDPHQRLRLLRQQPAHLRQAVCHVNQ